jgi:hypothetical protein
MPVLAMAGGVRGRFGAPDIGRFPDVSARLISIGPSLQFHIAPVGPDGAFHFPSVSTGSYVLEGKIGATRFFFRVVRVSGDGETDAGVFLKDSLTCEPPNCFADDFGFRPPPVAPRILDVCSALNNHDILWGKKIVVVGFLESSSAGPVLVGHCRTQFASGGYLWENAIRLPGFAAASVPDVSHARDWDKISEPNSQLSRTAAACNRRNPQPHETKSELIGVLGELSPQIGIERAKCRNKFCTPDIQFPPADLIKIEGLRKLK